MTTAATTGLGDAGVLAVGMGWVPGRPGGLNRYVSDLHRAMTAAHRPYRTVVYGPVDEPAAGVTVAGSEDASMPARLYRGWRVAQQPADVLSLHFGLYGLLPARLGRHRRTPVVVHFHGPWAQESVASGERSTATNAKQALERVVYGRAAAYVTLSASFRDLLVERYDVPAAAVRVIAPGVETDRFVPAVDRSAARRSLSRVPGDGPLVVAVRRMVRRSGIDVLLEAWSRLDDSGAVLAIAGTGPELDALRRRAAELGLRRVVWLGDTSDAEIVALYQAADLAVVPTRSLEGFGLVVLEALACGTPVVGTRVGGLVEVLPSLDDALLVPPEDPEALAAVMERVLGGWGPSRERCRAKALEYSWVRTADRLWSVYTDAGGGAA